VFYFIWTNIYRPHAGEHVRLVTSFPPLTTLVERRQKQRKGSSSIRFGTRTLLQRGIRPQVAHIRREEEEEEERGLIEDHRQVALIR